MYTYYVFRITDIIFLSLKRGLFEIVSESGLPEGDSISNCRFIVATRFGSGKAEVVVTWCLVHQRRQHFLQPIDPFDDE